MRQLILLPVFVCALALQAFAVTDLPADKKPRMHPMIQRMLVCLSPAEFTQLTGRKLNLPQRLAYQLMRKKYIHGLTQQQWLQTTDTLLLADGSTVTGIILANKPGEVVYKTAPESELQKADRQMVKGIRYAAAVKAFANKEDDKEVPYDKTANAALWLGIAGIAFLFIPILSILSIGFAIAAIVCGIIGLDRVKRSNGTKKGKGRATAGIVLGGFYFLLLLFVILLIAATLAGGGW